MTRKRKPAVNTTREKDRSPRGSTTTNTMMMKKETRATTVGITRMRTSMTTKKAKTMATATKTKMRTRTNVAAFQVTDRPDQPPPQGEPLRLPPLPARNRHRAGGVRSRPEARRAPLAAAVAAARVPVEVAYRAGLPQLGRPTRLAPSPRRPQAEKARRIAAGSEGPGAPTRFEQQPRKKRGVGRSGGREM